MLRCRPRPLGGATLRWAERTQWQRFSPGQHARGRLAPSPESSLPPPRSIAKVRLRCERHLSQLYWAPDPRILRAGARSTVWTCGWRGVVDNAGQCVQGIVSQPRVAQDDIATSKGVLQHRPYQVQVDGAGEYPKG
jgi:hypothetical protein